MSTMIELQNLTKHYGSLVAVEDMNLSVSEGEIFGFVGPNGAGKTTTLRMIAGLLQPTSGEIRVAGHSVRNETDLVHGAIGYMPDFFGVYNDMKVWEYMDFFAACYRVPEAGRRRLIDDLLELVDLSNWQEDWVDKLSRGMQQRLSLARTLVHDPQVLILDEPASGLDPRARVEIRELLVELAHMGKTIFFSTHILADVAEICTRVGIIEAGKLVAVGRVEQLQQQLMPQRKIAITLLDQVQEARALLAKMPAVGTVKSEPDTALANGEQSGERTRLEVEFLGDDVALSEALAALVKQGIPIIDFSEDRRDLETVFMRATKGLGT